MSMQLINSVIILLTVLSLSVFAGNTVNYSLSMSTGDKEFDMSLNEINTEARQSLPEYYTSMESCYGVRPHVIDRLIYHHFLSPADAYCVVRISIITGRPVEEVVRVYKSYKHKGWGEYARSLGIKPGSREFHELKSGGVVVLKRWRGRSEKKVIYIDNQDSDHHEFEHRDDRHEYDRDHGDNHDNDYYDVHGNGHDKGHGKR